MNLWEAIKELQEGKRIRESHYAKGVYLYMDDDGYIRFNDGEKYRFMSGVNLNDDEWEICGDVDDTDKDTRKEVSEDLKDMYNNIVVDNFCETEGYEYYRDYVNDSFEENYIVKLWEQLCRMNNFYKLDE